MVKQLASLHGIILSNIGQLDPFREILTFNYHFNKKT